MSSTMIRMIFGWAAWEEIERAEKARRLSAERYFIEKSVVWFARGNMELIVLIRISGNARILDKLFGRLWCDYGECG